MFDCKSRLLCLTTLHYFSYVDSNLRLAEVSNLINCHKIPELYCFSSTVFIVISLLLTPSHCLHCYNLLLTPSTVSGVSPDLGLSIDIKIKSVSVCLSVCLRHKIVHLNRIFVDQNCPYEFLRMSVPAKMKPNKPAKKDTNPPNYKPKPLDSKTYFVNIHKQDNHFRLAEGFLT